MQGFSTIDSPAGPRVANGQLHGVLVRVFDIGVLLTGDSGVGKTACAIELLRRGHALVADDAVQIFQRGAELFGRAPEVTRSLIHIRGVGIADVSHAFHAPSLLDECRIDLWIEIGGTNWEAPMPDLCVPHFRIEAGTPSWLANVIESIAREHSGQQAP